MKKMLILGLVFLLCIFSVFAEAPTMNLISKINLTQDINIRSGGIATGFDKTWIYHDINTSEGYITKYDIDYDTSTIIEQTNITTIRDVRFFIFDYCSNTSSFWATAQWLGNGNIPYGTVLEFDENWNLTGNNFTIRSPSSHDFFSISCSSDRLFVKKYDGINTVYLDEYKFDTTFVSSSAIQTVSGLFAGFEKVLELITDEYAIIMRNSGLFLYEINNLSEDNADKFDLGYSESEWDYLDQGSDYNDGRFLLTNDSDESIVIYSVYVHEPVEPETSYSTYFLNNNILNIENFGLTLFPEDYSTYKAEGIVPVYSTISDTNIECSIYGDNLTIESVGGYTGNATCYVYATDTFFELNSTLNTIIYSTSDFEPTTTTTTVGGSAGSSTTTEEIEIINQTDKLVTQDVFNEFFEDRIIVSKDDVLFSIYTDVGTSYFRTYMQQEDVRFRNLFIRNNGVEPITVDIDCIGGFCSNIILEDTKLKIEPNEEKGTTLTLRTTQDDKKEKYEFQTVVSLSEDKSVYGTVKGTVIIDEFFGFILSKISAEHLLNEGVMIGTFLISNIIISLLVTITFFAFISVIISTNNFTTGSRFIWELLRWVGSVLVFIIIVLII